MIVSIASAVLPVCRSPMISSRWPRPIGIMASNALMPVCTGVSTDLRRITPGAMRSTGRLLAAAIGPLPSIGCPSPSTTRPTSACPTGTSITRLALRTWPPPAVAADDFRVHATLDLDAAAGLALQPLRHQLLLWRGERDRGADLGQLDALRLAHSIGKRLGECGQKLNPFPLQQHHEQGQRLAAE